MFGVYPDNTVRKYNEIDKLRDSASLDKYDSLKSTVQGFAVIWPKNFLDEENLYFKAFEKEGLAPDHNFT